MEYVRNETDESVTVVGPEGEVAAIFMTSYGRAEDNPAYLAFVQGLVDLGADLWDENRSGYDVQDGVVRKDDLRRELSDFLDKAGAAARP